MKPRFKDPHCQGLYELLRTLLRKSWQLSREEDLLSMVLSWQGMKEPRWWVFIGTLVVAGHMQPIVLARS